MKYSEPRDRSAEVLRLALAEMGRHDAAFNPITFTVWYEFVAGINAPLKGALDGLLREGRAIDDACIDRLYREHVATPDDDALQRIGGAIRHVIVGLSRTASRTGDNAGRFAAQLNELTDAMQASDPRTLLPQLNRALAGTAEMMTSTESLRRQVAASQDEIARLRDDLVRARDESMLDPLTQVLNRKGFDHRVAALLALPPQPATRHWLLLLDIDHFKNVNDTHGHLIGDRVLQGLGDVLRACVATHGHAAARYGGEEFAIVLPHATHADAAALAETVRTRARAMKIRHRNTDQVLLTITVSCGAAPLLPGDDATALIARADAALYASKQAGRDRCTCIAPPAD